MIQAKTKNLVDHGALRSKKVINQPTLTSCKNKTEFEHPLQISDTKTTANAIIGSYPQNKKFSNIDLEVRFVTVILTTSASHSPQEERYQQVGLIRKSDEITKRLTPGLKHINQASTKIGQLRI